MDNSQTPDKKDLVNDAPADAGDVEKPSGGYYYDDETGYEVYEDDDDEDTDEAPAV